MGLAGLLRKAGLISKWAGRSLSPESSGLLFFLLNTSANCAKLADSKQPVLSRYNTPPSLNFLHQMYLVSISPKSFFATLSTICLYSAAFTAQFSCLSQNESISCLDP